MKQKRVTWGKDRNGKPVLIEYWEDQGPGRAGAVNRGMAAAKRGHRRRAVPPQIRPVINQVVYPGRALHRGKHNF